MKQLTMTSIALLLGSIAPETLLIWVLMGTTVIDFVTGVWASYVDSYKANKPITAYIIQSNRIRTSILKGIAYMGFILITWLFCFVFKVQELSIAGVVINIVTASIALCILIEVHSTFENLERCGYDFYGSVKKVVKNAVSAIKFVKKEVDEVKDINQ